MGLSAMAVSGNSEVSPAPHVPGPHALAGGLLDALARSAGGITLAPSPAVASVRAVSRSLPSEVRLRSALKPGASSGNVIWVKSPLTLPLTRRKSTLSPALG